jgi:DNA-binding MarR family transcriptional regulator
MSRSVDRDDGQRSKEETHPSRATIAESRGGGNGSSTPDDERREKGRADIGMSTDDSVAELATIIDQAANDKPTLSQFIERLEKQNVAVIPSLQSSGRLNGMSYRFQNKTIKGSSIGREYTAQGLQKRKGVQYDAGRDDSTLRRALEKAGFQRLEPSGGRTHSPAARETRLRDREGGLSPDQKALLAQVGRFRTVKAEDVIQYQYGGSFSQFQQDIRAVSERGLAERRTVQHSKSGQDYKVIVLTQQGRNYLRKAEKEKPGNGPKQQYHAGFVKPAEVKHDVGIYRMYQVEEARIEREGGAVQRVVLDFELKKQVFSELNKEKDPSDPDYAARKQEIAEQHGLKVVSGRIVFPDLRIEYETRDQEMNKVDLELVTGDYKNSQVQAKHAAGLKIYAPDSATGSPAIQDPEIVAGLISL